MLYEEKIIETIPVGPLGLIPLKSCTGLGKKVDDYLVEWRRERESEHKSTIAFSGYQRDSYILEANTPRFGSGEGKGTIEESVRGDDLYIMVDVCNYSLTYSLFGMTNHMSPDDHFQDLKRIIAAAAGKARRINVIMPFLYESRQHKRSGRESLDCAMALQELVNMGVENIITFDAHDPRVQNSIPLKGFETVQPIYQFLKHLLKNEPDLQIDSDHMMVISPDEGGTSRAIYFANMLGLDMGMFYKRRDYTKIVNGRNPIVAHEFLGSSVEGKDVLIIDDMISSGESMLDVAKEKENTSAEVDMIECGRIVDNDTTIVVGMTGENDKTYHYYAAQFSKNQDGKYKYKNAISLNDIGWQLRLGKLNTGYIIVCNNENVSTIQAVISPRNGSDITKNIEINNIPFVYYLDMSNISSDYDIQYKFLNENGEEIQ